MTVAAHGRKTEALSLGESEARRLRRELFPDELIDQLMASSDERGAVSYTHLTDPARVDILRA